MAGADQFEQLRGLEAHLRANLRGQDHVIAPAAEVLVRGELGLKPAGRPRGSFLFVGPTGSGKTELALCFTEYLFGPGHLHRFDMSEYQLQSSVDRLLDANGLLARVLKSGQPGTLLCDELEKAHPLVLDLFLQILDAARITLATGETLSAASLYVVFTSTLGAVEAMRMERSGRTGVERAVLRRVAQHLRPELIARIEEKLVFARLNADAQREICALLVAREMTRLRGLGHDLVVTREAMEFLLREGFDPLLGARPLRATVERHLQQVVVQSLFARGSASGRVAVEPCQRKRLALETP
ncbi:MAG: AAA family ATPase [Opitutaceae bacterium]|jgi:ATP-dependent Clp protease ATP-binding subunit ClpB